MAEVPTEKQREEEKHFKSIEEMYELLDKLSARIGSKVPLKDIFRGYYWGE